MLTWPRGSVCTGPSAPARPGQRSTEPAARPASSGWQGRRAGLHRRTGAASRGDPLSAQCGRRQIRGHQKSETTQRAVAAHPEPKEHAAYRKLRLRSRRDRGRRHVPACATRAAVLELLLRVRQLPAGGEPKPSPRWKGRAGCELG